MCAELKHQVPNVGQEKDDGRPTRKDEQTTKRVVDRVRRAIFGQDTEAAILNFRCVISMSVMQQHQEDSHAAGRMRVMHARVMRDELACAAVAWKVDSWK